MSEIIELRRQLLELRELFFLHLLKFHEGMKEPIPSDQREKDRLSLSDDQIRRKLQ